MSTKLLDQLQSALADRYAIASEIGRGGMATVYLAHDRKHGRPVALKVLNPELGAMLGVERFLAEIRVTATLQHPHLLPLFDSGSADGLLYYVMPFVEGESLRARLERERQLPVDEAVRITVAVAEALEYAHARGVIHRDLKPENILLQAGQPVVADFGIALAVSNAGGARITGTGLSLGTPQYMSPEQATGDHQLDARSDVYSLGAVAYEMLVGEPPHQGGTVQAVIARVVTERPAPVRARRGSTPEAVAQAVDVALEKIPADRWSSAREFAEALQGRAVRRPTLAGARVEAHGGRARRLVTLAAFAGLAMLAAAGWWRARKVVAPTQAFTLGLGADLRLASPWLLPLAVSPDGQIVAYVATSAGGLGQLFVKRADELHGRPLPGTAGAERPVFSADGRSIAYVTNDQLRVIPTTGGTSVPVPSGRAFVDGWPPPGMAWTRDGDFVIAPSRQSGLPMQLHLLPAVGGEPRALGRLAAGEHNQRWPIVLPDGETVLYTSYGDINDAGRAHIGVASMRGGASVRLDVRGVRALGVIDGRLVYVTLDGEVRAAPIDLRARRVTGSPVTLLEGLKMGGGSVVTAALSPSGTLAYLAGDSRDQELVFVDEAGARSVFPERNDYDIARVSPTGKQVALMVDSGGYNVWVLDREEGSLAPLTTGGRGMDPEWSADGRWIYFVHHTYGAADDSIFRQPPDRSAPASLVTVVRGLGSWALHPNGSTLIYDFRPIAPLRREAARVRMLAGDTTSRPLAGATEQDGGYRFSPDGRWLCFTSTESGTSRVFVRPFPAATPRAQVSIGSGSEPVWSADGTRLYYRDGEHFVVADLDFARGPRVTRRTTLFRDEFGRWGDPASYDVTRDERLILIRSTPERDEVVVIANWDRQVRDRLRMRR